MLFLEEIKDAVVESLSPDLLEKKYRARLSPSDPAVKGHCYVATEALYYLIGGKDAGFAPQVCAYYVDDRADYTDYYIGKSPPNPNCMKESHWWIKGSKNGFRGAGEIHDLTSAQFNFPFPYRYGKNNGFINPKKNTPSKRAQIVIDRVEVKFGRMEIEQYRQFNIGSFLTDQFIHKIGAK